MKLQQGRGRADWIFVLSLLIALCVSFLANVIPRVEAGYREGFLNQVYAPDVRQSFDFLAGGMLRPERPKWAGWGASLLGGVVLFGFSFLSQHFLWWPLHPLGVPIAGVWLTEQVWFSVFIAWLLKNCILKYGGGRAYKKSVPFFLGLILGQPAPVGVWFVVDKLLGQPPHTIFWL